MLRVLGREPLKLFILTSNLAWFGLLLSFLHRSWRCVSGSGSALNVTNLLLKSYFLFDANRGDNPLRSWLLLLIVGCLCCWGFTDIQDPRNDYEIIQLCFIPVELDNAREFCGARGGRLLPENPLLLKRFRYLLDISVRLNGHPPKHGFMIDLR